MRSRLQLGILLIIRKGRSWIVLGVLLQGWMMIVYLNEIVEHLRRFDVRSLVNDEEHSVTVESSIISNILSMDFDGCDDDSVFPQNVKFIQLVEKFEEGFKNTGLPDKHDYEKGKVSRDIAENSIFKDEKELTCSNGVAANELLGADVDEDFDVQTPGSGISILLAVGIPSTGSGNLYCQWELSPGSGNAFTWGGRVEVYGTVPVSAGAHESSLGEMGAFMTSSTIPAIYIQQFWDTMRDALQITQINDNDLFVAPPSSDAVIKYVNTLGYPCMLKNVSAMSVNDLYQPWRAILSMINMCLMGKTAGHDRPRHPVLQILWDEEAIPESPKATKGPSRTVVIREPDSGRIQSLPEVQGKGKEKIIEEQELTEINAIVQDEGQAGSNLGKQDEGRAGSNLEEERKKTNAELEVQSMVTVPIHQDTSSVPLMTTLVIDLTTSQSDSLTVHALLLTSTTTTTTITTTSLPPPPPQPQQSTTYPISLQRIAVDEIVTDVVDWARQAPLRVRFSDLPAIDMKEILQQRMFEDNSYKVHNDHKNLFKALQKSLERDYSNQLLADLHEARIKKRKKRDLLRTPSGSSPPQPPTLPPPAGASGAPNYLMNDDSILDKQVYFSNDEDIGNDYLPKADIRKDWWKPLPEKERLVTPERAWTISSSNVPALSISKMKVARYPDFRLELLVPEQIWINKVCTYDISAAYGISHWWFNRKKFYIDRHDSPSHQREVKKHIRILSVVRIKAFSRYGYDYLSKIVLRRAHFQEHKIVEKDFKNMYLNDFEDLNMLLLQGYLDHLSGFDKRMLSTAVKLWTRNLVIRQRVEDLQLGIDRHS
nr:putative nucleotide-binding alpha-beta plait domain, zinc finger, RING/FYVE/PHD-type [Tanacetum cinerariifolium]